MSTEEGKPTRVQPTIDKGGAWVRMGEKEYKVAPLNFKALRELAPELSKIGEVPPNTMITDEQMDMIIKISMAALRRNYPDLTEEDVADGLDFGNFGTVIKAVLGAAGIKKEEAKPGEEIPLQ